MFYWTIDPRPWEGAHCCLVLPVPVPKWSLWRFIGKWVICLYGDKSLRSFLEQEHHVSSFRGEKKMASALAALEEFITLLDQNRHATYSYGMFSSFQAITFVRSLPLSSVCSDVHFLRYYPIFWSRSERNHPPTYVVDWLWSLFWTGRVHMGISVVNSESALLHCPILHRHHSYVRSSPYHLIESFTICNNRPIVARVSRRLCYYLLGTYINFWQCSPAQASVIR